MAIQGFDYKGFAQSMHEQAQQLVPPNFTPDQKEYIATTLLKFSMIAGEALDKDGEFNADQAIMITQIIAEWSFHKSVDLINSGIPRQYWDPIMQKIALTIFEVSKNAFRQNVPQEQALEAIEHHVRKTYVDAIEELKNRNLIDDELMEKAVNQSNIDAMAQSADEQMQAEAEMPPPQGAGAPPPQGRPQGAPVQGNVNLPKAPNGLEKLDEESAKMLKLVTVAMLFQRMQQDKVQVILDRFEPDEANDIIRYMGMPDLAQKIDARTVMHCLRDFRDLLPAQPLNVSPTKIVNKIKAVADFMDRPKLELLLKPERARVRRFVFSALEGETVEMPSKVAYIIASHIESSI
ncbi:MAG: hypothetical protein NC390_07825 [Fusobacterium sp.]|nr:hypothetical protein [Fusobacterium sp.]